MMRRVIAWACAMTTAIPALAEATPTSRLIYSRDAGANSCPDEGALRKAVATRIGYDPFFAWANRTVVVNVETHGSAHVATVYLVDARGLQHGSRSISGDGVCGDLLDAVALAIAIAIDPDAAMPMPPPKEEPVVAPPTPTPAPTPAPSASSPPTPTAPSPPQDATPSRPMDRHGSVEFEGTLGLVGSVGIAPSPNAGASLGGALRWPWVSIGVEGRVDGPAGTGGPATSSISSWGVLGMLVPCARIGQLFGCALLEGGEVNVTSPAPGSRAASFGWWGAGGRLGGALPLTRSASLRLHGDVVADLEPPRVVVAGQTVWTSWPVAVSLGADALVRF